MVAGTLPLASLKRGEKGVIETVSGSSVLATRLRELGVVPGALVRMLRSNCPLVFQVGEDRLSIRRPDADNIVVRPLP